MRIVMSTTPLIMTALLFVLAAPANAVVYSFTNADGQYVVSQKPPKNKNIQYAVLSDEGEFIRSVPGRKQQIPISHWRPWYLPKEPHEFDGDPNLIRDREPIVTVDEEPSPD